jgi:uncharacterized protein
MVALSEIRRVGLAIGREFRPRRVILFGSHARGTATSDSDVDLLVIMPFSGKGSAKSIEIRRKINPPFAVDLLVHTPRSVRRRIAMGDCFFQEILTSGKVLYEADRR